MNFIQQDSITQIITGFDSAWTDNPKQPGAIASIFQHDNGMRQWIPPELTTPVDSTRFLPLLEKHYDHYGQVPRQCAADGGDACTDN